MTSRLAFAGRMVAVLIAGLVLAPTAFAAPGNGRVWEQVTPVSKPGAGLLILGGFGVQSNGNALVYAAAGSVHPDDQGSALNVYSGERGASGWETTPLSPANTGGQILSAALPFDVSDDLTKSIWLSTYPIAPGGPGGPVEPVLAAYAGTPGRPFTFLTEIGFISGASWATADLSHLAFTTTETGAEGAPNVAKELVGNQIVDVSVPPTGGDPFCGAQIGEFVGPGEGEQSARNAVSPDGSRIFFTGTPCGGTQRVYVRENAQTTRELSASACDRVDPEPACNAPSDVVYHGASKDGSTVLMSSAQQLTNDDTNQSWDVYSVDVASGALMRISLDAVNPTVDTRAEDSWITGFSEDAATVYFVAEGVLAAGAADGQKNLYVSRDGVVTFIATLDGFDFEARSGHPTGAYVTPDGDHLAFMTSNNLVPEDTDTQNQVNDIYLYDAAANTLVFASPGADGGTGVELPDPGANGRGLTNTVSEDGSSVILFSADRISPEDENFEYDLYEFADGQVSLVSGGQANQIAAPIFIGATPSGSDVFFTTNEELVAADVDGLPDVYDARVGGGFPTPDTPVPPAECREDACQGPAAERPSRPTPGSMTAEPEGDVGNATFRVRSIGAAARRRFARTGRLTLRINLGRSGDVAARARAKIGKRAVTVARARAEADGAGTAELTLRLSKAARRALRNKGTLRVTIRVTYSENERARSTTLVLRAPKGQVGRRGR
jgi:Tol biopolymer transport system component